MTAQDLFKHVMRDLVAPQLRELGFQGSCTRAFCIEQAEYGSRLWTQKNRYSTKTEVDFWIHMTAGHGPTRTTYWRKEAALARPGAYGQWLDRRGRQSA